jgi:hypothetical protein
MVPCIGARSHSRNFGFLRLSGTCPGKAALRGKGPRCLSNEMKCHFYKGNYFRLNLYPRISVLISVGSIARLTYWLRVSGAWYIRQYSSRSKSKVYSIQRIF